MTKNLIFVSHCNFHGNSAMHLFSIANILTDLGHSCAVCVPNGPETVLDHGQPRFQVLEYKTAERHGVSFPNGQGADLVHAWTPRELVRKTTMSLVQRYKVPYFVHLEDNEIRILLDELPQWSLEELEQLPVRALDALVSNDRVHPHHWRRLLAGAAGVTALIDRLLEFKPSHVPGMVIFPGYDCEFAKIFSRNEELRAALGIAPDELLIVYTGNVHRSNWREVRSLVLAIALVNRRGIRAKLVKTGWNAYVLPELSDPGVAHYVIDRGFVARSEVPRLLAAADALVQPGHSGEFNDYRFPSKLPEFLASGRPVIVPRSNVGLLLKDGEEALLLERGDSVDIANALQRLATDSELQIRIGRNGRIFAQENLDWRTNVTALSGFYDGCLGDARSETSFRINHAHEMTAGLDDQHARVAKTRDPFGSAPLNDAKTPHKEDLWRLEQQSQRLGRHSRKTDTWFTDDQLAFLASKYCGRFEFASLSYATVRDFCDSFDHLHPLATASGDLKDNQRPWALKAILSVVPPGGRVLEIGAGEPFIADILARMGYEVWVVDPYDGTGNGPLEFERFQTECPTVHFIRGYFSDLLVEAPPEGFDCIYSISVLEHIPPDLLGCVFAGIKKYLKPNGWSIHAVDHVHRGKGAEEHYEKLKALVCGSGLEEEELTQLCEQMDRDPETYFLSAEGHNRWRGALSYDNFPMRVCVNIQFVTHAARLRTPDG